jgi:outer membrane protein
VRQTTTLIGGLLVALCVSGPAGAGTKIGYLDVTRVAEESPQYQAARKSLQDDLERRENDLRVKAQQLKTKEDKLQRDAAVMSDSEAKRIERDIVALRRKLQNSRDEYRDELSLRQNEERAKLLRQVAEVVKAIGKEEGYDLILTDGVAYYSKGMDISDRVLTRLKQSFRAR